ncbi:unnamed protein product [Arabidopsis halleri]
MCKKRLLQKETVRSEKHVTVVKQERTTEKTKREMEYRRRLRKKRSS